MTYGRILLGFNSGKALCSGEKISEVGKADEEQPGLHQQVLTHMILTKNEVVLELVRKDALQNLEMMYFLKVNQLLHTFNNGVYCNDSLNVDLYGR